MPSRSSATAWANAHESERVAANFEAWMTQQDSSPSPSRGGGWGEGATRKRFTEEHLWWLEKTAEHIASYFGIEAEDLDLSPFDQRGGLGRVHQLFGPALPKVIEELNAALVA